MTTERSGMSLCGGCGNSDSSKRCVGCLHDFEELTLRHVRDALLDAHNSPGIEQVLDSCVKSIDAHLKECAREGWVPEALPVPNASDENLSAISCHAEGYAEGWNACRKAMLAARKEG